MQLTTKGILRILTPDDGLCLTNGLVISYKVYLGIKAPIDDWQELTPTEAQLLVEENIRKQMLEQGYTGD